MYINKYWIKLLVKNMKQVKTIKPMKVNNRTTKNRNKMLWEELIGPETKQNKLKPKNAKQT